MTKYLKQNYCWVELYSISSLLSRDNTFFGLAVKTESIVYKSYLFTDWTGCQNGQSQDSFASTFFLLFLFCIFNFAFLVRIFNMNIKNLMRLAVFYFSKFLQVFD